MPTTFNRRSVHALIGKISATPCDLYLIDRSRRLIARSWFVGTTIACLFIVGSISVLVQDQSTKPDPSNPILAERGEAVHAGQCAPVTGANLEGQSN